MGCGLFAAGVKVGRAERMCPSSIDAKAGRGELEAEVSLTWSGMIDPYRAQGGRVLTIIRSFDAVSTIQCMHMTGTISLDNRTATLQNDIGDEAQTTPDYADVPATRRSA